MDRKQLVKAVRDHCKRSGESPYAFCRRVLGDQTFLWKLENLKREPRHDTIKTVMNAIQKRERDMDQQMKKYGRIIGWE